MAEYFQYKSARILAPKIQDSISNLFVIVAIGIKN